MKLPFPPNTVVKYKENEKQFQELWGENWRGVNCSSCCWKRQLWTLSVAVKFSVQLLSQCWSALEPFPWSKTSPVSTIFSHECSPFYKKDMLPTFFIVCIAVKGDSWNIPCVQSSWDSYCSSLRFAVCCPCECALEWATALQEKRTKTAPRSQEQPKAVTTLYSVSNISLRYCCSCNKWADTTLRDYTTTWPLELAYL